MFHYRYRQASPVLSWLFVMILFSSMWELHDHIMNYKWNSLISYEKFWSVYQIYYIIFLENNEVGFPWWKRTWKIIATSYAAMGARSLVPALLYLELQRSYLSIYCIYLKVSPLQILLRVPPNRKHFCISKTWAHSKELKRLFLCEGIVLKFWNARITL